MKYKPSANVNVDARAVPAIKEPTIKAAPPATTEKFTKQENINNETKREVLKKV